MALLDRPILEQLIYICLHTKTYLLSLSDIVVLDQSKSKNNKNILYSVKLRCALFCRECGKNSESSQFVFSYPPNGREREREFVCCHCGFNTCIAVVVTVKEKCQRRCQHEVNEETYRVCMDNWLRTK